MTTPGRQGVMGLRRVGALGARRPSGTLGAAVGEAGVNCRGLATTALQKVNHAPAEIGSAICIAFAWRTCSMLRQELSG